MYHKVADVAPTEWWAAADDFFRHLCELRGYDVVALDDYDPRNPRQAVITFDGVYENVLTFAAPLLHAFGYPFECFVTGDLIGHSNDFDTIEPAARFTSMTSLERLVALGGRLQWHTASHPDLTALPVEAVGAELDVPPALRALDPLGFRWFAYPYGRYSDEVRARIARQFAGAVSCTHGSPDDRWALPRVTATSASSFARATVGVVIPCHNYGAYLDEAIRSVLRQTRPPTRVHLSDDGSTDDTEVVGRYYADLFPSLITFHRNPTPLGIVDHFNQAVGRMDTDYVCLLGADNRFRADYLEQTTRHLDTSDESAVCYTDFALFGPKARLRYAEFPHAWQGETIDDVMYIIAVPDATPESRQRWAHSNFIHGSSLFRRQAWDAAGRYRSREEHGAEDGDLFKRMLGAGWGAAHVAAPLLEYRQHSNEQANLALAAARRVHIHVERHRKEAALASRLREALAHANAARVAHGTAPEAMPEHTAWAHDVDYLYLFAAACSRLTCHDAAARAACDAAGRASAASRHDVWASATYVLAAAHRVAGRAEAMHLYSAILNAEQGPTSDHRGGAAYHIAAQAAEHGDRSSALRYAALALTWVPHHRAAGLLLERLHT